MAIEEILTYLQDVLDAINDMESCFVYFPNRYDLFENDISAKTTRIQIVGKLPI